MKKELLISVSQVQKAFRILFKNFSHLPYFINWKYFQQLFYISEQKIVSIYCFLLPSCFSEIRKLLFFFNGSCGHLGQYTCILILWLLENIINKRVNFFMTEVRTMQKPPVHWFAEQIWFLYDRDLCHERVFFKKFL